MVSLDVGRDVFWMPDHCGEYYLTVLRRLHERLKPQRYLEIGCHKGASLGLSKGATLAIDPNPDLQIETALESRSVLALYRMTSDEFFKKYAPNVILGGVIDLAFIDGMHLCEYALRDFINVERSSNPESVIVMHDCLPVEWPMAERENPPPSLREQHKFAWTGDVWRTAVILKKYRPDLCMRALDAPPSGLLCITNLSPGDMTLHKNYSDLVEEMMGMSLQKFGIGNLFRTLSVESTSRYYE